jgi:hypothetical protein
MGSWDEGSAVLVKLCLTAISACEAVHPDVAFFQFVRQGETR